MAGAQADFQPVGWTVFKIMQGEFFSRIFANVSILACAIGLLVILTLRLSLSSKRLNKPIGSLPCLKGPKFFSYLMFMKTIYWSSTKKTPALCLLLQFWESMCILFDSEKIYQLPIGLKSLVFIYKPEAIQVVLSSTTLIDKPPEYGLMESSIGTGLVTSSGKKWQQRRKLLNPAFHFSLLIDFLPIFYEQSNAFLTKLQTLSDQPWVDITPMMSTLTLNIICQSSMGVRIDSENEEHAEYFQSIHEIGELILHRLLRPWLYPNAIFQLSPSGRLTREKLRCFHGFSRKVIKEKKESMLEEKKLDSKLGKASSNSTKKRRAFLELLLEYHLEDPSFTEDDIREEVDTVMVAGHETAAVTLSFSLYLLGLDERVQNNVHDELDEIFGVDIDREITLEDINKMNYLECVIKETLRLYPPAPFYGRMASESFQVMNYTVPKGSTCMILSYPLHHDKSIYPEPERFVPERFLPENSVGRHPYAFVPFSSGPRSCIGKKYVMLEVKLILANILRRYRVTSLDPRDKVNLWPHPVLMNVEPLRLRFTLRK